MPISNEKVQFTGTDSKYNLGSKLPSFRQLAFILIQLRIHAISQLRPVSMQSAFPASGVPAEEPILVSVWSEAITPLVLPLASTRSLQVQILY